jgi:hypothetical protein
VAAASSTPAIIAGGTANLFAYFGQDAIPQGYIDLDTGSGDGVSAGDLTFLAGGGTDVFFVFHPVNGASATLSGLPGPDTATPRLEDCASAHMHFTDTYPIGPGDYVCVRTDRGRLSLVRVESVDDDSSPYRVSIRFITWE